MSTITHHIVAERERALLALVEALERWHGKTDAEIAHAEADRLLLQFINDPRVATAFNKINKYYA